MPRKKTKATPPNALPRSITVGELRALLQGRPETEPVVIQDRACWTRAVAAVLFVEGSAILRTW